MCHSAIHSFPQRFVSIESKHEVTLLGGLHEFVVKFYGPVGSKCTCHCNNFMTVD